MRYSNNIFLWVFAAIGVLSIIVGTYRFIKYQTDARNYRMNCFDVRIGMSISEAKKVMGDYDWFDKIARSEIWIDNVEGDSIRQYYLTYPSTFGASEWPMLFFDPNTMRVTNVVCAEP